MLYTKAGSGETITMRQIQRTRIPLDGATAELIMMVVSEHRAAELF
jgi:hypothetical protein